MRLLENIHHFDVITFGWCLRRKHREQIVNLSRYVSRTADGPLYFMIGAVLWACGYQDVLPAFLIAFAIERATYAVVKKYFKRNRPPEAIPGYKSVIKPSDQFSFPSGHTSAAFLMTVLLLSLFPGLFWVLIPWAMCVGVSRVMLGVHFPTDIVAGATLGTITGLWATQSIMLGF
ncbi:phosphatase PAP2 family protein [Marinibactrum halimedae]|uniref:undecaprenyl-diphosphate phosphatase n=1 Tax=Marinibactrum halimedae TaxID=1444977 RepID=A0AA37WPQ4_9GAMM|nr:phosphatase PAP2 family protein [Marinibactrum halimedae]MCD9460096.1 phosphatase PAP2 family protein [Marinibactrum halimedae]GLS26497.1 phosphatase PAP2 family protein [Marinibactrum halimedae]